MNGKWAVSDTMKTRIPIETYTDGAALARAAAERFVEQAGSAIAGKGRFSVVLAGGSTPKALYRRLAADPFAGAIDWTRVHVFWGDERTVPPDHMDSNFRMAHDSLLSRLPIPVRNIHRISGEADPQEAAQDYDQTLRSFFADAHACFDLVLLGMGDDGHTASLFPGSEAVEKEVKGLQGRWVVANYVEKLATWRITMTTLPINGAAHVIFLVSGEEKAGTLQQVLNGPYQPRAFPSQLIRPHNGRITWMLDADAAHLIE